MAAIAFDRTGHRGYTGAGIEASLGGFAAGLPYSCNPGPTKESISMKWIAVRLA